MAADIYVAENFRAARVNPPERSVWLDDTGYYWHLYRYFEGAKVQRAEELVDLYGGAEIDGYELDRLEDELKAAREHATHKPDEWKVLTGWNGKPARENEIWRVVKKAELLEIIARMIWLIDLARTQNLKLIVSGD
ncbi:MAG: hypothetical protein EBR86_09420 [Planctomycetia bacterium]|nr:hypothetical protein [Planctomycetia bacterium]